MQSKGFYMMRIQFDPFSKGHFAPSCEIFTQRT